MRETLEGRFLDHCGWVLCVCKREECVCVCFSPETLIITAVPDVTEHMKHVMNNGVLFLHLFPISLLRSRRLSLPSSVSSDAPADA